MIAPLLAAAALAAALPAPHDWTRFGYGPARSSSSPDATGITAANAARLQRQRVGLDGTVDSSPIFLHDVSELSLNFAVFAKALRATRDASLGLRLLRAGLLRFDRFFQLERLHSFNRKFFPVWRPRFVCFERWTDAPLVALAYLHVEQLLTPPGPWVRDEDLAAV